MSFLSKRVLTTKNRKILWGILFFLLVAYVFFGQKYKLVYNSGESMLPSYRDGEMLVVERIKKEYAPERFDAVMIEDSLEEEIITKRILGLPGEKLQMIEGKIYINDKPLLDPYYTNARHSNEEIYSIPRDCVWVIGDDRIDSIYGIFLLKEVRGIIVW